MDTIVRLISAGIILGFGAIPAAAGPANRDDYVAQARRIIPLAQRGDAHAQAMLGFMYANGRGVPQSYDVAVDWYLKSADQGDPSGQHLLGLMYDKGFGVTQNVILAHKWLNLAAAHAPRRNREYYLRLRDAVASKMSGAQIDVARRLALEFVPRSR